MRHRVFIAINLPEDIKRQLALYQEKIEELFTPYPPPFSQKGRGGSGPIRWTKKESLHITLMFLGYLADDELLEVLKITKDVATKNQSFTINLNKICYGPPKKMPPRMIWVEGEKSREFTLLRDDLEKSLLASGEFHFSSEKREFSPHITLGRIRQWEFRQIEPEERPVIDTDLSLSLEVNSIEVMESQLKRGGAEYTTLLSAELTAGKS